MRGWGRDGACLTVRENNNAHSMKSKLLLLPLVLACLALSSCFSAGLEFRNSFSGRVTPGERVRNGVLDVVTLPVQVPVIAAIAIADAAD